jgi:hypothetical protein
MYDDTMVMITGGVSLVGVWLTWSTSLETTTTRCRAGTTSIICQAYPQAT